MRAALDQLPIEQRKALVLVTVNGLSYDEAAVIVQYKVGTIKRRVSRVRLRHMELLAYSLGWHGSTHLRAMRLISASPKISCW